MKRTTELRRVEHELSSGKRIIVSHYSDFTYAIATNFGELTDEQEESLLDAAFGKSVLEA